MPGTLALLLLATHQCWARQISVTIDDTFGDARTSSQPHYVPDSQWVALTPHGNDTFDLEASELLNGTVHTTTSDQFGNMSLTFTGTSIQVFIVDTSDSPGTLEFYLDGDSTPTETYTTPNSSDIHEVVEYNYNHMVFQRSGLPQKKHSLIVRFPPLALMFFDYAIYTLEDGSSKGIATPTTASAPQTTDHRSGNSGEPSNSPGPSTDPAPARHRLPIGAVVAISIAGAAFVLAACTWIFVKRRHRRLARAQSNRTQRQSPSTLEDMSASGGIRSAAMDGITPFVGQPVATARASPKGPAENASVHVAEKSSPHNTRSSDAVTSDGNTPLMGTLSMPAPGTMNGPSKREHRTPTAASSSSPLSTPRAPSHSSQSQAAGIIPSSTHPRPEETSEGIRAELDRARAEIAMWRLAAEPPPYSDHS